MLIESLRATVYLLATAMLALAAIVLEIFAFAVKMCMNLTFRMGHDQMQVCQPKGHARLSMCWQLQWLPYKLCHRLRDNHLGTCRCTRFEF